MKSKNIYKSTSFTGLIICLLCLISITGCKKYLEIPLPSNKIAGEGAYSTDKSSAATLSNVFGVLASGSYFDGGGAYSIGNIGFNTGLYTDELQNLNPNSPNNNAFYQDAVSDSYTNLIWVNFYKQLYNINLAIEGISASTTLIQKDQWLGEAYFLRAFCYFYLTNYYGDVVLTTSSDFLVNKDLGRSPKADVYKQIIADLLQAQSLLTDEYKDATGAVTTIKGRPNKFTATALLARAYLYTGDWANAEIQADNVINGTIDAGPAYTLLPAADIDQVFLAGSEETIFALVSSAAVKDFVTYNNNMPATISVSNWLVNGVNVKLSESLTNAFESNDLRKTNWVRSTTSTVTNTTYYYPNKYKSSIAGEENIVLFRLSEQYLIRAEARARQNHLLEEAKEDLNKVRNRAGLAGTTAVSPTDIINAVLEERRVELFTEVGHRFFDLKRTGTIDAVMAIEAPLKGVGATWNSFKQYFPISAYDVSINPKLIQTPGY